MNLCNKLILYIKSLELRKALKVFAKQIYLNNKFPTQYLEETKIYSYCKSLSLSRHFHCRAFSWNLCKISLKSKKFQPACTLESVQYLNFSLGTIQVQKSLCLQNDLNSSENYFHLITSNWMTNCWLFFSIQ